MRTKNRRADADTLKFKKQRDLQRKENDKLRKIHENYKCEVAKKEKMDKFECVFKNVFNVVIASLLLVYVYVNTMGVVTKEVWQDNIYNSLLIVLSIEFLGIYIMSKREPWKISVMVLWELLKQIIAPICCAFILGKIFEVPKFADRDAETITELCLCLILIFSIVTIVAYVFLVFLYFVNSVKKRFLLRSRNRNV